MKRNGLILLVLVALTVVGIGLAQAPVQADTLHQVVVCKYVGTPGVDERLQTGQNPIVVDYHSLPGFDPDNPGFPWEFADAQGRSIAIRWAESSHDGSIEECPGYVAPTPTPTTPPPTPTETPTTPPQPTPTTPPTKPTPTTPPVLPPKTGH